MRYSSRRSYGRKRSYGYRKKSYAYRRYAPRRSGYTRKFGYRKTIASTIRSLLKPKVKYVKKRMASKWIRDVDEMGRSILRSTKGMGKYGIRQAKSAARVGKLYSQLDRIQRKLANSERMGATDVPNWSGRDPDQTRYGYEASPGMTDNSMMMVVSHDRESVANERREQERAARATGERDAKRRRVTFRSTDAPEELIEDTGLTDEEIALLNAGGTMGYEE